MKQRVQGLVIGLAIGGLLSGSVAYATSTYVNAEVSKYKYMFNGSEKTPDASKGFVKGLVYQGRAYVPLAFVGEALGQKVEFEGKTGTIWVGKKIGAFDKLTSIEYARMDIPGYFSSLSFDKVNALNTTSSNQKLKIAGIAYDSGFSTYLDTYDEKGSIDYNLNGHYSKLRGYIGIDDSQKNSKATGKIIITGDGKELYSSPSLMGGDLPTEINIDVTGVLKLQIAFVNEGGDHITIDFADSKVIQ